MAFRQGTGNNALQPEAAKTKTVGLVCSPSFVPGPSATIDWFNIQVSNKITAFDAVVLDQCCRNNVQSFCGQLQRKASGEIINMSLCNVNLGKPETEGVDLGFNYRFPRSSYGNFTLRSDSTWVKSYRIQSEEGAEWDEYNGECLYHRLKSNLSLDCVLGNWNATVTSRYVSGTKDGCFSATPDCSKPNGNATFGRYNKIGSLTYSDLSVGYKTPWEGQVTTGANNVFDKAPRVVRRGQASSSVADPGVPIDRFVYLRYNQAF